MSLSNNSESKEFHCAICMIDLNYPRMKVIDHPIIQSLDLCIFCFDEMKWNGNERIHEITLAERSHLFETYKVPPEVNIVTKYARRSIGSYDVSWFLTDELAPAVVKALRLSDNVVEHLFLMNHYGLNELDSLDDEDNQIVSNKLNDKAFTTTPNYADIISNSDFLERLERKPNPNKPKICEIELQQLLEEEDDTILMHRDNLFGTSNKSSTAMKPIIILDDDDATKEKTSSLSSIYSTSNRVKIQYDILSFVITC